MRCSVIKWCNLCKTRRCQEHTDLKRYVIVTGIKGNYRLRSFRNIASRIRYDRIQGNLCGIYIAFSIIGIGGKCLCGNTGRPSWASGSCRSRWAGGPCRAWQTSRAGGACRSGCPCRTGRAVQSGNQISLLYVGLKQVVIFELNRKVLLLIYINPLNQFFKELPIQLRNGSMLSEQLHPFILF